MATMGILQTVEEDSLGSSLSYNPQKKEMSRIVEEVDRGLYGLRSQEIIATNQSRDVVLSINSVSTFSTKKGIFPVQDQQFSKLYNKKFQRPLVAFLLSSIPDEYQWTMNVVRLGFKDIPSSNPIPIVIHLLIETPGFFNGNEVAAVEILNGMERNPHSDIRTETLVKTLPVDSDHYIVIPHTLAPRSAIKNPSQQDHLLDLFPTKTKSMVLLVDMYSFQNQIFQTRHHTNTMKMRDWRSVFLHLWIMKLQNRITKQY
ncbi:baa500c6-e363-4abb-adb8-cc171d8f6ea1-CDS [Sclerotinia trifoliorum]|uniref:Baa500c6-e363-4abb-adb8-cc171d8f6ea1-CDS n=1 Tax=Sclerotinia trifoliorum TaxID=28548 RepID=A0A8H2ZRI1_9HELO|nr:baa500c6-e363-4abb-adb8-cc171d8f6ea1-CDS [Sclerotinia trifoliorum]